MTSIGFPELAEQAIDNIGCGQCGEPFSLEQGPSGSDAEQDRIEFEYECSECGLSYDIAVFESNNDGVTVHYDRHDMETHPDRPATGVGKYHKRGLYREVLPVSDTIDALDQFRNALRNLTVNKERLDEIFNRLDDDDWFDRLSDDVVSADIHNYLAASYTFEERHRNLESVLATDGPIEAQRQKFKEDSAVIIGLRIYEQHHLSVPFTFSSGPNEGSNGFYTTIHIDVETVRDMDYDKGADHHYSSVGGEQIDFKQEVEDHYRVAVGLFKDMWDRTYKRDKDEIQEYHELTDISSYY